MAIRRNNTDETNLPVLMVRRGDERVNGHEVTIKDDAGKAVAKVVYVNRDDTHIRNVYVELYGDYEVHNYETRT